MPEGPELHTVAAALERLRELQGGTLHVTANDALPPFASTLQVQGKHLLWTSVDAANKLDWFFAMTGTIGVAWHSFYKVNRGYLPGYQKDDHQVVETLGVDWWTESAAGLQDVVTRKMVGSRGKLGPLLLKQDLICGLGVAWGSEVLHAAGGLRPDLPAKDQDLSGLVPAMMALREHVAAMYQQLVLAPIWDSEERLRGFITEFYDVCYQMRTMQVYRVGQAVKVGDRTWWV